MDINYIINAEYSVQVAYFDIHLLLLSSDSRTTKRSSPQNYSAKALVNHFLLVYDGRSNCDAHTPDRIIGLRLYGVNTTPEYGVDSNGVFWHVYYSFALFHRLVTLLLTLLHSWLLHRRFSPFLILGFSAGLFPDSANDIQ